MNGKDELIEYLANDGAARFLKYLRGLTEEQFATKYATILELSIPKLQRQDPKVGTGGSEAVSEIEVSIK